MTRFADTILTQVPEVITLSILAKPYLIRRKGSGRYTMRLRKVGSTTSLISIGLRTTSRSLAMNHLNELSATAKAFLLDNPEATAEELRGHLKDMAERLLTDASDDYWDGVEVSHLHDAKANLREIAAKHSLSIEQHHHLAASLKVIDAAQKRVNEGDAGPLLDILKGLGATNVVHNGDSTTILKKEQGSHPAESNNNGHSSAFFWDDLAETYRNEKAQEWTPATLRDIQSVHKTLSRFLKGINMKAHTREQIKAVRDSLDADGLAPATINKALAKLEAVVTWGNNNGYLNHNYTKGLKRKNITSDRKAFSEEQLAKVVKTIKEEPLPAKRFFGLLAVITGARCGELTQLTKKDIIKECVDGEGIYCVDLNDKDAGKSLKNKYSIRQIPITDGAFGFSLSAFLEYVHSLPDDNSLIFGMSRDIASKWFNEQVLPHSLPERTKDHVLHSLRHTLATTMKEKGVTLTDIQGVMGHSSNTITFDVYGKGHSLKRLKDALALSFSLNDLSH